MTPQTSTDPIDALEVSRHHFEAATQGFSDSEALAKPAAEQWSVIDCIEHICITESLGLKRLQSAEAAPEPSLNPEKEAAMAAQVENRATKFQGPPVAMPTGRFATLSEALAEFAATRGRTIEFVRDCPSLAALRVNHPVFGQLTGREYALLIAGHCRRHAAQIAEIRATSAQSRG
ncbi:MAG: DinB family protein [Bryobacteraceae bacterium]|jgi:DinB superfamily